MRQRYRIRTMMSRMIRHIRFYIAVLSVTLCVCNLLGGPLSQSDVDIVRTRFVASVLPSDADGTAEIHALGAKYAATLRDDGTWPDVNYADQSRAAWKAAAHLDRTLLMAKSARLFRNAGKTNTQLESQTLRATSAWTTHDYKNPNWWWNQIGAPQLLGEIACLIDPILPPDQREKIAHIIQRGDWRQGRWTGGNLTWVVTNQIVQGCIQHDPQNIAQSYQRMYEEIKIVSPHEEGIQADFSFHQHGDQLYNGAYGLMYGNDVGRFISYAWGTPCQAPPDKLKLICSYLLDGQEWMMRDSHLDYSVCGRGIVRPAPPATTHKTDGPVDPAGAAYSLPHVVSLLAAKPTPWQKDLRAFAARLVGDPSVPPFVGNKQFWCSDYMMHRRPNFFTSVKMLSNRMLNGEEVNSEGKKSVHLSDGANYLYLTGNEYQNIFPVWDWTKIPGTTAIQETLDIRVRNPAGQRGRTPFAGGVTDGTFGTCAMDLSRGHLSARKAWFFFDNCYACLGSAITLTRDPKHPVATTINQTLLEGPVTFGFFTPSSGTSASGEQGRTGEGRGGDIQLSAFSVQRSTTAPTLAFPLSTKGGDQHDNIRWVHHNHVAYIFPTPQSVHFTAINQSGHWSDIGAGPSDLISLPVFTLWLNHSRSCHDASYQYFVYPNISAQKTEQLSTHLELTILANAQTQAVYDPHLQLLEAVFRVPATLKTPLGSIGVDHECMFMLRSDGNHLIITAANPENTALELHVRVDEKSRTLSLPGGNLAGQSVSANLP